MKLSYFIDIALILLIAFFLIKHKRNVLENIFIFMVVEFLLSCYYAILFINLDVWTIAKGTELFVIFRFYEVLINPILYLSYFNVLPNINNRLGKALMTLLLIFIVYGLEWLLVRWNVIIYTHWEAWQSLVGIVFVLLVMIILTACYGHLLKKEGIRI